MSRAVDTSHPQYTLGVLLANRLMDTSGVAARDHLAVWQGVAQKRHHEEDVPGYLYARGLVDTLRAFVGDAP